MKFADSCFLASLCYPGLSNGEKLVWSKKALMPSLDTLQQVMLLKFLSREERSPLGTSGSLLAAVVLKPSIRVLPARTLSQHRGSSELL